MNWYLKVFKQYADFTGRARRKEYWMYMLFNFFALIVIGLLDFLLISITNGQSPYGLITVMYSFAILIPNLAVVVRRLHDTGRSAWWLLISIISIWLFVLMLLDSKPGVNRFGVNPKEESTREKDKTKSAAVALILAASIWLATTIVFDIIIICNHGLYGYLEMHRIFATSMLTVILKSYHYLIPIALLILGISLSCKNSKKQFAAIFLIIVGAICLYYSHIKPFVEASVIITGMLMFDINAILEILYVAVPIALVILGLSMLRVNSKPIIDSKIASLLLLIAGFLWILKLIYQIIVFPIWITTAFGSSANTYDIIFALPSIVIPISFIVLAFSLRQNKDNIPAEDERVLECKRIRNQSKPPIRIGFAIVCICVGLTLFIPGIAMLFDKVIRAYGLIPLTVGLFLWTTGVCGLVVRRKRPNKKLVNSMGILTLVAFILSCAIIAFAIITPIMIEILD